MLKRSKASSGFTLVEIIIGIVVLGIALVVITGALGPLYKQSTDPWHQVRAAELGHSLLNEIMARSFDQNSDRVSGEFRCGENGTVCTACDSLGSEAGESRTSFNDVDDFNGLSLNDSDILASPGGAGQQQSLDELYAGYSAAVLVSCAGAELGLANAQLKKVQVTITAPSGSPIGFVSYRGNW
ncbi:prepilin-type N-terminal cleavage/methylation domain-containing protein [Rheinheimera sp.]|uniref:type IV pilus modification PilV family protein n=1 Tax=Rheinheimera sp. TaxID=1869214 RepID=UPI00307E9549